MRQRQVSETRTHGEVGGQRGRESHPRDVQRLQAGKLEQARRNRAFQRLGELVRPWEQRGLTGFGGAHTGVCSAVLSHRVTGSEPRRQLLLKSTTVRVLIWNRPEGREPVNWFSYSSTTLSAVCTAGLNNAVTSPRRLFSNRIKNSSSLSSARPEGTVPTK